MRGLFEYFKSKITGFIDYLNQPLPSHGAKECSDEFNRWVNCRCAYQLCCPECGSWDIIYRHDFSPMEGVSESTIRCNTCGHVEYLME